MFVSYLLIVEIDLVGKQYNMYFRNIGDHQILFDTTVAQILERKEKRPKEKRKELCGFFSGIDPFIGMCAPVDI